MRIPIKVRVRRNDKVVVEDGVLWVNEVPFEYRRGTHRAMKSSAFKRSKMRRLLEEQALASAVRSGDVGRTD